MLISKNINKFFQKNSHKKLISRRNMQPDAITRREYEGKIFVKNIRTHSCSIRKPSEQSDPDPDSKKSFRIHNTDLENHFSPKKLL